MVQNAVIRIVWSKVWPKYLIYYDRFGVIENISTVFFLNDINYDNNNKKIQNYIHDFCMWLYNIRVHILLSLIYNLRITGTFRENERILTYMEYYCLNFNVICELLLLEKVHKISNLKKKIGFHQYKIVSNISDSIKKDFAETAIMSEIILNLIWCDFGIQFALLLII